VGVKSEPDPDVRHKDDEALEEIRRLFARYRQTARHGQVTERGESAEPRTAEERDAAALPGR
jgi:hypothetical protein